MSKKAILEGAITAFAEKVKAHREIDILEKTHGVWQRDCDVEESVDHGRKEFSRSMMLFWQRLYLGFLVAILLALGNGIISVYPPTKNSRHLQSGRRLQIQRWAIIRR